MKKLLLKGILNSAAALLVVFSCSCSRSIVSSRPITNFAELEKKTSKNCTYLSKSNLRLKFKTNIDIDGKSQQLNGRIFLLSDTCVYINVMSPTLGIEVGRLCANRDSVIFINKLDKTYFSSDYHQFIIKYGLNFRLLYSVLSASYFGCDSVKLSDTNTQYFADMRRFVVSNVYNENDTKSYSTSFFDSFGNLYRTEYKSGNNDFLRVNYSNFALKGGFPQKLVVSVGVGGTIKEIELLIDDIIEIKSENIPNLKTGTHKYKRVYL